MKKNLTIFFVGILALQSCFSTRFVGNENVLRREFNNVLVDDVEYKKGKPDSISRSENGYAYIYLYEYVVKGTKYLEYAPYTGQIGKREEYEQLYERFSFDNNHNLRNVQSTNVVPVKRFDVGRTIGVALFASVIIIPLMAAATSK